MSLLSQDCSLLLYACLGCTCLVSAFVVASGLVVALPPPLLLAQLKNINSGNLPLQIRRKIYQAYLVGPSVASVVDSSSKRSSVKCVSIQNAPMSRVLSGTCLAHRCVRTTRLEILKKLIPSFLVLVYIATTHNFTVSDTSWPTSPILCVHERTLNSSSLPSLPSRVTTPRPEEF